MTSRRLDRIMQLRCERFARQQEGRKSAELAMLRDASDALGRWQGECNRRACRRARRCAGKPVEGTESFRPFAPACITRASFEPVRLWVLARAEARRRRDG